MISFFYYSSNVETYRTPHEGTPPRPASFSLDTCITKAMWREVIFMNAESSILISRRWLPRRRMWMK
jgi:hypothetical protein